MTFGLRNAGQTFQRYMNHALGDLDFVFIYIDDILIASRSPKEHEEHVRMVFERLNKFHLQANIGKCVFGQPEVIFLSHKINAHGLLPTDEKVSAVRNFPKPQTLQDLRRFLGMVNFYRPLLNHAAETQHSLNEILRDVRKRDTRPVLWTAESESAFEACKSDLASCASLAFPDDEAEIRIVCDASDRSMGAALEQRSFGKPWHPISFFSRKFSNAQLKYSTYDRELTSVFEAIRYFHHYLEGRKFEVFTDHKPLQYALQQNHETAPLRRQRQIAYIGEFTSIIRYLPGEDNTVADALSRIEEVLSPATLNWSKLPIETVSHPEIQRVLSKIDAFRLPTVFSLKQLSEEQANDAQLRELIGDPSHPLKLHRLTWGEAHTPIFCDTFDFTIRPYIPASLREEVFKVYHSKSHPSAKVTCRLIRHQYVWPDMSRDIAKWCKTCLPCQQSKITRHNKFLPRDFAVPDGRFAHVHIDIVGPLVVSNGYRYILTMIDRYSRWPEATPMTDATAQSVARAFYDTWVTRYGAPETLTSDQGEVFESQLFTALRNLIGCDRTRTTAYHPASNGLVERIHRDMKAAIMCYGDKHNWSNVLSTVLLGLRTRVRLDTDASPAEFVFGTSLRIPGEFCLPGDFEPNQRYFLEEFREYMKEVKPVPVARKFNFRPFVFKDLATCSHVHVRDLAKKSLDRPYQGPFKIVSRISDVNFVIDVRGDHKVINVERLIPAHFVDPAFVDSILGPEGTIASEHPAQALEFANEEPNSPPEVFSPPSLPALPGNNSRETSAAQKNQFTSASASQRIPHRTAERTYARKRDTYDHTYSKKLLSPSIPSVSHVSNP